MKEIPLTQGKVALVDEEDYEWLMQWKWNLHKTDTSCYAERRYGKRGKSVKIRMHQEIIKPNTNLICDHINGDGLDNRRCNLRLVTYSQNNYNNNGWAKSGFKGVRFLPDRNKSWQAYARLDGKFKSLGYYATPEAAARAYDAAAKQYFGEFARLNFPEEI